MKSICVTGSQGFIGSYICAELLSAGYKVFGIDNYSKYGYVKRPHDNNPNFILIREDVMRIDQIAQLKDISLDCVVACAAMVGGISYFHKYAYDLFVANERILASTFDFALDKFRNGSLDKILVLSSSMVFERTNVYPTPESEIETCPPPLSTYGFQKLSCEYFCKGAYEQYGLPFIVIRPFNCVGIGEGEAKSGAEVVQGNVKMLMSHVVPDLVYKVLKLGKNGKLPILGKGNQIRHYTYGGDIAKVIRLAIESPAALNDDFNVSSDRAVSVKELAEIIWRLVYGDAPLRLVYCEPYQYDVQIRSPDVSKLERVLGFKCETQLEDVLLDVISWIRKQYHL